MDPVELESLMEEFTDRGINFGQVSFDQLEDCSEDPEEDGPLPSVLMIEYCRYGYLYREPVCGRCCASKKIRALLDLPVLPDCIHVHVLSWPRGEAIRKAGSLAF